MKTIFLSLFIAFCILTIGVSAHSQERVGKSTHALSANSQWLTGNGMDCNRVCQNAGEVAVPSGIYTKSNASFNICRTNAHGEGSRPGYNLIPSWASVCVVGYGGKEESFNTYDCMCTGK